MCETLPDEGKRSSDWVERTPHSDAEIDGLSRSIMTLVARQGWRRLALLSTLVLLVLLVLGDLLLFARIAPHVPGDDGWLLMTFMSTISLPVVLVIPLLAFSFRIVQHLLDVRHRLLIEIGRRLEAEKRLRRLATTDELTGLDNRRQFFARGREAVALARRYGHHVALLAIDLDRFKQLNDRYGHKAGDDALATLANVLRGALRSSDVPARFGGDEFMVLMPQTDLASARIAAERIREAFAAQAADLGLTLSIGAAAAVGLDAQVEDLLARADCALYEAKLDGRDCVRLGALDPGARSEMPAA